MRPMADLIRNIVILLTISFISKSYTRLEKKIVGGDYVKIRHHPHAVYLEIINKVGETHICGSSVLNQLYLLSAAHCFYGDGNYQISAFAGHENIKNAIAHRKVRTSIVHDNFKYEKVENDIALLLLYRELPLGKYIKRITLKRSFPNGAASGVVAGWGIINDITGQEPISLKSVRQSVKSKRLCAVVGITKSTFCAGSMRSSDPRPAAGDSGSGLVTPSFQLLGIVSYKLELHSALPVYTNVSYFYHWIKQQTQFAYCQYKLNQYNKKNKN